MARPAHSTSRRSAKSATSASGSPARLGDESDVVVRGSVESIERPVQYRLCVITVWPDEDEGRRDRDDAGEERGKARDGGRDGDSDKARDGGRNKDSDEAGCPPRHLRVQVTSAPILLRVRGTDGKVSDSDLKRLLRDRTLYIAVPPGSDDTTPLEKRLARFRAALPLGTRLLAFLHRQPNAQILMPDPLVRPGEDGRAPRILRPYPSLLIVPGRLVFELPSANGRTRLIGATTDLRADGPEWSRANSLSDLMKRIQGMRRVYGSPRGASTAAPTPPPRSSAPPSRAPDRPDPSWSSSPPIMPPGGGHRR